MRSWKKGAVIGGLWGLVSSLSYFVAIPALSEVALIISDIFIILTIPMFLGMLSLLILNIVGFPFNYFSVFVIKIFVICLSILFGTLIGSFIGFAIEKYKQWRVTNEGVEKRRV